jgi:hypothetical protein
MLLLPLLFAGCTAATPDDTAGVDSAAPAIEACDGAMPPTVAACVGGDAVVPGDQLNLVVTGSVVSVAVGPRPAACTFDIGNRGVDEGLIVTLADSDGTTYVVALAAPDLSPTLFAVGDPVYLSATHAFLNDAELVASFTLSDPAPTHRFLVAQAPSTDHLPESPILVGVGERQCVVDEDCGSWYQHDLELGVGSDSATVPYGGEVQFGSTRLLYGGYSEAVADQTDSCPDWVPEHLTVALIQQ